MTWMAGVGHCGWGTYASRISKLMNIPHISAGDLVRDEIKRGTPLGAEMSAGAYTRSDFSST
jgi:adenylate kinase